MVDGDGSTRGREINGLVRAQISRNCACMPWAARDCAVWRRWVSKISLFPSRDISSRWVSWERSWVAPERSIMNSRHIGKHGQSIERFYSNNILFGRNTLSSNMIMYRLHGTNKLEQISSVWIKKRTRRIALNFWVRKKMPLEERNKGKVRRSSSEDGARLITWVNVNLRCLIRGSIDAKRQRLSMNESGRKCL
jgi:hypothetical protein